MIMFLLGVVAGGALVLFIVVLRPYVMFGDKTVVVRGHGGPVRVLYAILKVMAKLRLIREV